MDTKINKHITTFAEGGKKFEGVPVFQVVNDVGSSVRWTSGQMISLEYGEHANEIAKIPDWEEQEAQSASFQRRFDALNDDLLLAVNLDRDIDHFNETFLHPLLDRLSKLKDM